MQSLVTTDARSRVVLPGHANQQFLMRDNEDGSVLLEPARIVSVVQEEYDANPELRELLSRAAASGTVRRQRKPRTA